MRSALAGHTFMAHPALCSCPQSCYVRTCPHPTTLERYGPLREDLSEAEWIDPTCARNWSAWSSHPFYPSTTRAWRSLTQSEKVRGAAASRKARGEAVQTLAGSISQQPLSLTLLPAALGGCSSRCGRCRAPFVVSVHMWGTRSVLAFRGRYARVCADWAKFQCLGSQNSGPR